MMNWWSELMEMGEIQKQKEKKKEKKSQNQERN